MRVHSPIYRPSKNPFWVLEIKSFKTVLSLFAIDAEAILYTTLKSDIGRQFFKNSLG